MNFAAADANIPKTARNFGEKIHFVHFRDVTGSATNFRVTWHDKGPTAMPAAMQAYRDGGFDRPIRLALPGRERQRRERTDQCY